MKKKFDEVRIGVPYLKAVGSEYGYRVFDGIKWHDCDRYGKIKQ